MIRFRSLHLEFVRLRLPFGFLEIGVADVGNQQMPGLLEQPSTGWQATKKRCIFRIFWPISKKMAVQKKQTKLNKKHITTIGCGFGENVQENWFGLDLKTGCNGYIIYTFLSCWWRVTLGLHQSHEWMCKFRTIIHITLNTCKQNLSEKEISWRPTRNSLPVPLEKSTKNDHI